MTELLAQVQPLSQSGLHTIIAGVVLLLGIGATGVGIYTQLRRKPPLEAEFVSKNECLRNLAGSGERVTRLEDAFKRAVCTDEFRSFRSEIEMRLEHIRTASERDMREILDRISELQADVTTAAERRCQELHGRITRTDTAVARLEAQVQKGGRS